jgi:preprotein translocase subunit YajC
VTVIGASGGSGFFLIIILAFFLLWLIVVRPQRKRQSQQQQMLNELHVGDEVLTAGGIYGTITRLDETEVTVEIAPQLEVRVARRAIAGVTRDPDEEEEADDAEESAEPEASAEPEEAATSPETADDSIGASTAGEASVEEDRG